MNVNFEEREIHDFACTESLYHQANITRPQECDYTLGIFENDKLVACASIKNDILLGFAIQKDQQGEGLLLSLCTHLIKKGMEMGYDTLYIFTKPEKANLFIACGFREIVSGTHTSLLEWGKNSIEDFTRRLRQISTNKPGEAACIVMNANPFTLGHQYLIETAAKENEWLYLLVVEEDQSVFPFDVRIDLIRKGTAGFPNVTVLSGEKYVISMLTFPTYFTKPDDVEDAQSELDLKLFCRYIAPALKIGRRYVGVEPYCVTTNQYNVNMNKILPAYGIDVIEIARKAEGDGFISASKVRDLLRQGKRYETRELLPESTFDFLFTPQGEKIIEQIKKIKYRHG